MPRNPLPHDTVPDPYRQALIDQTMEKLRKRREQELPGDTATFDEIEEALTHIGDALLEDLQQEVLQRRTGKKARDNQSTCACGRKA